MFLQKTLELEFILYGSCSNGPAHPLGWQDCALDRTLVQQLIRAAFPNWLSSLKEGWLLVKQDYKTQLCKSCWMALWGWLLFLNSVAFMILNENFLGSWNNNSVPQRLKPPFKNDIWVVLQIVTTKTIIIKVCFFANRILFPGSFLVPRSCKPGLFHMDIFGLEMISHIQKINAPRLVWPYARNTRQNLS